MKTILILILLATPALGQPWSIQEPYPDGAYRDYLALEKERLEFENWILEDKIRDLKERQDEREFQEELKENFNDPRLMH